MYTTTTKIRLRAEFKDTHKGVEVLDGRATYFTGEYVEWLERELYELRIARVSESAFIDAFENAVHGDMWQHEDDHDYSKGMEQMDDAKIKDIAKTLYDGLYHGTIKI